MFHKTIGFCNVGSADYTERVSKDHVYSMNKALIFAN